MLQARCFHLICTPTRCINLVQGILLARRKLNSSSLNPAIVPLFVWEPVPDSCGPDELVNVYIALKFVDVVSPNHHELAALFRRSTVDPNPGNSTSDMEEYCRELIRNGFDGKTGAVVVRCGERGCYVATGEKATYLPAFFDGHLSRNGKGRVVDPTGAGNAFLYVLVLENLRPITNKSQRRFLHWLARGGPSRYNGF